MISHPQGRREDGWGRERDIRNLVSKGKTLDDERERERECHVRGHPGQQQDGSEHQDREAGRTNVRA